MVAKRKGGIACLLCGRFLETRPWEPMDKEALEKGWSEISIKRKDIEEIFFFCKKCTKLYFRLKDMESKKIDNLSKFDEKKLMESGYGIMSIKAKNFEGKFLLDSESLRKFLNMIEVW